MSYLKLGVLVVSAHDLIVPKDGQGAASAFVELHFDNQTFHKPPQKKEMPILFGIKASTSTSLIQNAYLTLLLKPMFTTLRQLQISPWKGFCSWEIFICPIL
ncbi:hypothetical protein CerSpe_104430 [Prunus speciosa]